MNGILQTSGVRRKAFWYEGSVLQIFIDDHLYQLGSASGDGHNCLIDTLRQKLNERPGVCITEGCVSEVRRLLEEMHRYGATPIERRAYLELETYWQDIIDLLEAADNVGNTVSLGSPQFEIVCVDLMFVGNGDRLPQCRDDNVRRQMCIARVNGNHFVPLRWVGNLVSILPAAARVASECAGPLGRRRWPP